MAAGVSIALGKAKVRAVVERVRPSTAHLAVI